MSDPEQVIAQQFAAYGRVRFLATKEGFTPMTPCEQFGHEWVGISFGIKQCEFCGQLKETM